MSSFAGTTVEIRVIMRKPGQDPLVIERVTEAITDVEMRRLRDAVPAGLISRLPEGTISIIMSERFGYTFATDLPSKTHGVLNELTRVLFLTMNTIYRRLCP